jgi:Helix-turn-helix domain
MASALHSFTGKSAVGAGACTKNIPQYGDKSVVSSVAVFVFFPDLPQRDFFGGDRLAIPASDVLEWRGGIAPPGVRTALHHEKRRRGLRQSDVARLVGLSRPQLSNLQQGRFGASPEAAARIREFLIDGAKTVGGSP